jgi:hypothetical protein
MFSLYTGARQHLAPLRIYEQSSRTGRQGTGKGGTPAHRGGIEGSVIVIVERSRNVGCSFGDESVKLKVSDAVDHVLISIQSPLVTCESVVVRWRGRTHEFDESNQGQMPHMLIVDLPEEVL